MHGTALTSNSTTGPFSRANLFNTFITLQLFGFTQPYGSLLFRDVLFRHVGGLSWRCNPIASVVEALIIALNILQEIFLCCREHGGLPPRKSVWGRLRAVAGGLLLLRGATGAKDGGKLIRQLMNEPFIDGYSRQRPVPATPEALQPAGPQHGVLQSTATEQISLPTRRTNTFPAINPDTNERSRILHAALGSRQTNTIPAINPETNERSRILHAALGSNALVGRESRIDFFATISMILFSIKIAGIRGIPVFQIACGFMITDWMFVQVLLFILHADELSEDEMLSCVKKARDLNAALKAGRAGYLYILLHVSLLAYTCYAFMLLMPSFVWYNVYVRTLPIWLVVCVMSVSAACSSIFFIILGAPFMPWSSDNYRGIHIWLRDLVLLPITLWACIGSYDAFRKYRAIIKTYKNGTYVAGNYGDYTPLFPPDSILHDIIDVGFPWTFWRLGFLCCFLSLAIPFAIFGFPLCSDSNASSFHFRIVAINQLIVLFYWGWYMISYNPEATQKPNWTEWFG